MSPPSRRGEPTQDKGPRRYLRLLFAAVHVPTQTSDIQSDQCILNTGWMTLDAGLQVKPTSTVHHMRKDD
jgi:hypothetical protein